MNRPRALVSLVLSFVVSSLAACGGEAATGPTTTTPPTPTTPPAQTASPTAVATTAPTASAPPPPACGPRPKPTDCATPPTFAEIEPVMRARCNGCHSPGAIAGEEHDFSDPAIIRTHKERMVKQLMACKMPPRRPISEEEALLILRWAACGTGP